jgi:RNA polymerase sigma-70 factor, ECF subfamily
MALSWTDHVLPARVSPRDSDDVRAPALPVSGTDSVALHERGNPKSKEFVELYRNHVAYVWGAARRLGLTPAEADDVVQETFLSVLRLADGYTPQGAERSWLFSLLYRAVQHHRRSYLRRTAHTEDGVNLDVLPASSAAAPDKCAETSETVRILEEILEGLDPERRAVLLLTEVEEKPVSEIAEILGINVNTVASRLRLAREQVEAAIARRRARDGWRYK